MEHFLVSCKTEKYGSRFFRLIYAPKHFLKIEINILCQKTVPRPDLRRIQVRRSRYYEIDEMMQRAFGAVASWLSKLELGTRFSRNSWFKPVWIRSKNSVFQSNGGRSSQNHRSLPYRSRSGIINMVSSMVGRRNRVVSIVFDITSHKKTLFIDNLLIIC